MDLSNIIYHNQLKLDLFAWFEEQESVIVHEEKGEEEKKDESDVYISQYLDYSSKYGIGFLLNNGSLGVFFNDFTKIVIDQYSNYI